MHKLGPRKRFAAYNLIQVAIKLVTAIVDLSKHQSKVGKHPQSRRFRFARIDAINGLAQPPTT
jgi:hypothetical protein